MPSSASVRSLPSIPGRLTELERAVADLRRRLDDLEASLASVDAVRDDVRRSTEQLTEGLNQVAAALAEERATP